MRTRWLLILVPLVAGCGYNRIQTLDEQTNQARSQIEVQLQRRADLIPNLVNTVKGYASHEQQVFEQVAKARSGLLGAIQTHDPQQMADANATLTSGLGRLLAISEAYPQLKADQSFLRLQDELTGTENRIGVARRNYNNAIQDYNTFIGQFPNSIWAGMAGFHNNDAYFKASPAAQAVPNVKF